MMIWFGFEWKEQRNYDFYVASQDETRQQVENARKLIEKIKGYFSEKRISIL